MKRRKNNLIKNIGIFLIMMGAFSLCCKWIYEYAKVQEQEQKVEDFFEEEKISTQIVENNNIEKEYQQPVVKKVNNYIGILKIPSISLKKGFYSKDDSRNNVNKNITILNESDFPDTANGHVILAGHSGSGRLAYFTKLEYLNIGDTISIYYQSKKYNYEIFSINNVNKTGSIKLKKFKDKSTLTLTTCSQKEKGKQVVIDSKLINIEDY